MLCLGVRDTKCGVTLCVRVWIEIDCFFTTFGSSKFTLCVRVWIEISCIRKLFSADIVTLCVRVWIEIVSVVKLTQFCDSHPLRGCGLKCYADDS